jgi:sarcosine oxidase subunit gamma
VDKNLSPKTALGASTPLRKSLGPWELTEVWDLALASVAPRRGREDEVAAAFTIMGRAWPGVAEAKAGVIWLTPEMVLVEGPEGDLRADLKAALGDAASITEQTDAWVRFDLKGPDLPRLFEKLCNVDLAARPEGYATRTVIEHIGCYLILREGVTVYGPRSMAQSLLHAIETAAAVQA